MLKQGRAFRTSIGRQCQRAPMRRVSQARNTLPRSSRRRCAAIETIVMLADERGESTPALSRIRGSCMGQRGLAMRIGAWPAGASFSPNRAASAQDAGPGARFGAWHEICLSEGSVLARSLPAPFAAGAPSATCTRDTPAEQPQPCPRRQHAPCRESERLTLNPLPHPDENDDE